MCTVKISKNIEVRRVGYEPSANHSGRSAASNLVGRWRVFVKGRIYSEPMARARAIAVARELEKEVAHDALTAQHA